MATKQKLDEQNAEYAETFNAPDAVAVEPTEDESFGITPEVSDAEAPVEESEPVVALDAPAEPEGQVEAEAPAEEIAETPADEAVEPVVAEAAEGQMTEQQLKSWEGRLKKQQAELDAGKGAAGPTEEVAASVEDAIESVASGEMTADEAMAKLSDDFGPEFVSMIVAIAQKASSDTAGESVRGLNDNVEGIIAHLKDNAQRMHFETLHDAHPDFMEISASPEFEAFLGTRDQEVRGNDARVLESGSAREIITLLDAYKKSMTQADGGGDGPANNDDAAADAEGVRSGGIQLPATPSVAEGYEEAWNES